MRGVGDIDREALRGAIKIRNDEDSRILNHRLSLASWSNAKLFEAGFRDNPSCELCGCSKQTTLHLLHECPALAAPRQSAMRDYLPDVNIEDLPVPLQLGIPLAMTFTCDHTFWGSPAGDLQKPSHDMGCYHSGRIIHKDVVDSVSLVNDLYGYTTLEM